MKENLFKYQRTQKIFKKYSLELSINQTKFEHRRAKDENKKDNQANVVQAAQIQADEEAEY